MLQRILAGGVALTATVTGASFAQGVVRFVDVGPGLCVVAEFPGDQQMVYDAGHRGDECFDAVQEIMGTDDRIELIVISHPDYDHYADLVDILNAYEVDTILETGFPRELRTRSGNPSRWWLAHRAMDAEALAGASVIRLSDTPLDPGHTFALGDASATFIAGWGEWPAELSLPDDPPDGGQFHNVISIVMRLDYAGRSVLLTGDTSGRRRDESEPLDTCRDAQLVMVNRAATISIDADVMTSAHHGARNGDAPCFVNAVSPQAVVISAGGGSQDHGHPQAMAAQFYIDAGVPIDMIFRTDRGDGPPAGTDPAAYNREWEYGQIAACGGSDPTGDDTIEMRIPADPGADFEIEYLAADGDC